MNSVLTLQSSFKNEPIGNKIFAVLLGALAPGFFFAFGLYASIGGTAGIVGKTIGLVGSTVVGFIFLGLVWPNFFLKREVVLYEDRIQYRGFWSTTQINYSNVTHAMSAREGKKYVLAVFSRSQSAIGLGDGFRNEDKEKMWSLIHHRLTPLGVKFYENLSKSEAYERAIEIDKEAKSKPLVELQEEITRNITKAVMILGFGFIFVFGLFMFYSLLIAIIPVGFGMWTIIGVVLMISMLTMFFGILLKRWIMIGWSVYGLGLTMVLFGFQMIIAEQAWLFGIFILFMAALTLVLGRGTAKQYAES
jgi:hypothetical protein